MTHPRTGYECDCGDHDDELMFHSFPCGGCAFNVRTYRDEAIHWRAHEKGIHWHVACAFRVLASAAEDVPAPAYERIAGVRVTDEELIVAFADGRSLPLPLGYFPRLLEASAEQRANWRLIGGGQGIHWPVIGEDLSAQGLLRSATRS